MSAPQPRILETYNSLTDKHLVGYFSNARIRRHLQKSGLISRSGRIIPEKEYRLNAIRRDHQRHVQGCLADAIYHKVLDIEHHHQLGISRRLDCSATKEKMQSAKIERLMGQVSPLYAPHPPVAPRNHHALCPLVSGERTGRSLRRGPRLRFDYGDGRYYFRAKEPPVSKVRQSSELKFRNPMDYMSGASPYRPGKRRRRRAAPVPPPRPHVGDRCIPGIRRGLPVERWFHSTTGFNEQFLINNTNGFPKSPLCSNALVTMIYLGKSKHVSLRDHKDEIKVYQQYCGTENICVYKGDLLEGDTFQFISKRYLGYPFSLTFFLNGLQVDRLSSCCEYRGFQTKRPCRLQRRNTYFRVLHVAGAPPCYRCFLAMGLDKKLYPPKKKLKFYSRPHMCSCSPYCAHSEPCDSNVLPKSIEDSVSLTIASQEDSVDTIDETVDSEQECCEEEEEGEEIEGEIEGEEEVEEEAQTEDRSFVETEGTTQETTTQETTSESEYDEDFEDEEVNEEGQIGDLMNGMSKSSSNDKNHNLDYGKETETSSQKALQASDSEKDKSGRYSDDRDSEDDLPERRPADSLSSMSTQCSTETDSQAEMKADHGNCKEDCNIKSTSDSAAHAHCGNENGEKKLLRVEENQENSALEKKGIDEAGKTKPEDLTAREDTRIFHENIRAMRHQNPEVNGEFEQTGSGESDMNEEEEECAPVPWDSRVLSKEDGNEEPPWREEGGVFEDCKPVQEGTAKATGNDHPVNSDPEPGDLCANEEEKNAANTEHSASGAADGRLLAEGRRSLDVQEAAARAGEATGPGQAPGQDGAAGGDAGSGEAAGKAAGAGDALPRAGTGAALGESAPEEGTVARERPRGKGTGPAVELGTEGLPGEQQVLAEGTDREVALGKAVELGTEGPAGEQQGLAEGMDREVALGKAVELGTEGPAGEQQGLAEGTDREVALGRAVELGTEGPAGEQQVLAEGTDREVALGKAVELGTEGPAGEQQGLAEGMDREVALGKAVELGTEGPAGEQQGLAEGTDREVALGRAVELGTEGPAGEQQGLAEGTDREVALGKAVELGTEGPAGEQEVLAEGMDREVALGRAVELGTEGPAGEQQGLAEGTDREVALGRAVELGTEGPAGEQEVLAEGMDREVALGRAVELGTEGPAGEQQGLAEGTDREVALGRAVELGTEGPAGEQEVLAEGMDREVALGRAVELGTEGPAGALPGGEAHRAVPQGQEEAGGTAEEEAADEGLRGAEEDVGEPVSEAGEPLGQGGSAGKDTTVAAVSEGEDAGEDAGVAATDGNARAVGPEGEKAVDEDFSEGEEALGKPGALWEALGDMETGEVMSGGKGFVKPSQFSQLKVSEEEWLEMGKAVPGAAAALESAQALQRVEDTRAESVEADKGPALEVAPGLGALGGARGDPVTEGSSQVEETLAVQEEGTAEALWSGNPSEGSEAETERAVEGKPEGEAAGGSAGAAGAGSGDEEEATDGAAGSEEPAAGTEGWLRCGQGRCPGEGEPGLVAIAVLGGQAGPGALPGGLAVPAGPAAPAGPAVPGAGGLGTGAMAQAGVAAAAPGAQGGAGAQPVSAAGREPGGAGEGPAGAPAAAGPEGKREAAAGGEARAAGPAGARQPEPGTEPGTEPLGPPAGLGAGAPGEQAAAQTAPSSPGHGGVAARARGAGGEGLCPGTPPQPAATATARGRHGRQEPGMERDAGQAGEQRPSAPENTRQGEVAAVSASAGPAARAAEPRKDGPVGGSPSVPAAADGRDRSRSSRQDSANPDPLIMSSEEDGEETLL